MSESDTVSIDEAISLAIEIAEALGGRQARALKTLIRYAERGRSLSKTSLRAVGNAAQGVQHFVRAKEELERGMEEMGHATHGLARAATNDEEEERPTKPPPPEPRER